MQGLRLPPTTKYVGSKLSLRFSGANQILMIFHLPFQRLPTVFIGKSTFLVPSRLRRP